MTIIWHRDDSVSKTQAEAARNQAAKYCRSLLNVDIPEDAHVGPDEGEGGLLVEARVWIECDKSGKPL
jgi:hypothetical protein